jgi:hypothetical protein
MYGDRGTERAVCEVGDTVAWVEVGGGASGGDEAGGFDAQDGDLQDAA